MNERVFYVPFSTLLCYARDNNLQREEMKDTRDNTLQREEMKDARDDNLQREEMKDARDNNLQREEMKDASPFRYVLVRCEPTLASCLRFCGQRSWPLHHRGSQHFYAISINIGRINSILIKYIDIL